MHTSVRMLSLVPRGVRSVRPNTGTDVVAALNRVAAATEACSAENKLGRLDAAYRDKVTWAVVIFGGAMYAVSQRWGRGSKMGDVSLD
jgi:hypothetical protein